MALQPCPLCPNCYGPLQLLWLCLHRIHTQTQMCTCLISSPYTVGRTTPVRCWLQMIILAVVCHFWHAACWKTWYPMAPNLPNRSRLWTERPLRPKMTKRPPSSTGWLQVWRCIMFSQIRSWCLRTTYARVVDDRQLFIPKFCSYGQRFLQFTDVESGTFDHETRYNDERSRVFCWTSSSNFEILGNRYVQIPCSKILIWWLQWHWYNVIGDS